MTDQPTRFGKVAQFLHWITAILVVVAFVLGPEDLEDVGGAADPGVQWHQTIGLCVMALTLLRVLWMFVDQRPQPVPMARWMHLLSKSIQGILYLLLIAVPVTAIVGLWLEGDALTLVAGLKVAPQLAMSKDLGERVLDLHKLLADAILWLAGLHAAAALYHHHILKDRVLETMLPAWLLRGRGR